MILIRVHSTGFLLMYVKVTCVQYVPKITKFLLTPVCTLKHKTILL